jgi:hypothetical protein
MFLVIFYGYIFPTKRNSVAFTLSKVAFSLSIHGQFTALLQFTPSIFWDVAVQ